MSGHKSARLAKYAAVFLIRRPNSPSFAEQLQGHPTGRLSARRAGTQGILRPSAGSFPAMGVRASGLTGRFPIAVAHFAIKNMAKAPTSPGPTTRPMRDPRVQPSRSRGSGGSCRLCLLVFSSHFWGRRWWSVGRSPGVKDTPEFMPKPSLLSGCSRCCLGCAVCLFGTIGSNCQQCAQL